MYLLIADTVNQGVINLNSGREKMDISNKSSPISIDNHLKKNIFDDYKYVPKEYRELASNMESQFAKLMLDQMNNTVERSEGENDSATNIYRDLLTTEQADLLSKNNGGLGLQDIALDQIYPKKFRNQANLNAYLEQTNQRNLMIQKTRNQRADLDTITVNNKSESAKEISHD